MVYYYKRFIYKSCGSDENNFRNSKVLFITCSSLSKIHQRKYYCDNQTLRCILCRYKQHFHSHKFVLVWSYDTQSHHRTKIISLSNNTCIIHNPDWINLYTESSVTGNGARVHCTCFIFRIYIILPKPWTSKV